MLANQKNNHIKVINITRPAHVGAHVAAKPLIPDMIRNAAPVGLLPEQPLLARLDAVVEPPSSAPLKTLGTKKAAQAADEAWQQTVQGDTGPTLTNPTIPDVEQTGLTSQHDDDDSEPTFAPP